MASTIRFQFRLWHLIAVMTLVCVGLAWVTHLRQEVVRQKEALHTLEMHSGSCDSAVTSAWKEWLAGGPVNRRLTVRFQGLYGQDQWGPYQPNGKTVKLHSWTAERIPQVGAAIAQLPGITVLSFNRTRLGGHLTELIPHSRQLTYLDLCETHIRSPELAVLSRTPNLRQLSVRRTSTDDEGLRHIARLRDLEWLNLGSTNVTDDGMPLVASLTRLKTLSLDNTHVTDAGLRSLRSLRNLEQLDLEMTLVTQESLPCLAEMGITKRLTVPAEWDQGAIERLSEALPATCQVSAGSYRLKDRADAKAKRDVK